jgi:hypothetical protein
VGAQSYPQNLCTNLVAGCGLAAALQTGPESFKNSCKLTCVKLKLRAISDMKFNRI